MNSGITFYFNPTLVWFEPNDHNEHADDDNFNPTLVWFELNYLLDRYFEEKNDFNPTLVWFEQFML